MTAPDVSTSPLDSPPPAMVDQPLFAETVTLLRSVRDHDFDTLADLCDDDFGIVDIAPDGAAVPVRTREDWERWFRELFATLDAMSARTDSRIDRYDVLMSAEMAYSVIEFRQTLAVGELVANFDCVATIIWKRRDDRWIETRWHCSVIDSEIPEELLDPA